jgi:hypothetical protein
MYIVFILRCIKDQNNTVFPVQTRCSPSMDENFDQREGALHVLPVCTQGI